MANNTTGFIDGSIDVGSKYVTKEYLYEIWPSLNTDATGLNFGTRIYSWGDGSYGALGTRLTTNRSSPTVLYQDMGPVIKTVALGYGSVFATVANGAAYSWGFNQNGELGNNATIARSSPLIMNVTLGPWKKILHNNYTGVGIGMGSSSGTLYGWGCDGGGTGHNTTIARSSPTLIGTGTKWIDIGVGSGQVGGTVCNSYALDGDTGLLYAWGYGDNGQLGNNSTITRSSPVQVSATFTFKELRKDGMLCAAFNAIAANGCMMAWGDNSLGYLGNNTTISRSTPTLIGTETTWYQLTAGAGIKSNGTLWVWGENSSGRLGLNDLIHRSSPVQLGTSTNWRYVSSDGFKNTAAIKKDGSLWVWGANEVGQLGNNSTIDYSSPIQVGTSKNWVTVSVGVLGMIGVISNEI